MSTKATVNTYSLKTAAGRHIRMATMVTLEDGKVIRFVERVPSKGEAIRQAREEEGRGQ